MTRNKGAIESIITWTFEPDGGGSRVTVRADYSVPLPLLGKVAERFVVKQNEHEVDALLANLKTRLEG